MEEQIAAERRGFTLDCCKFEDFKALQAAKLLFTSCSDQYHRYVRVLQALKGLLKGVGCGSPF